MFGTIYRHPGSNALVFCEKLNATLSNLNKSNKKFLILGDLNLNTTGCNQHPHAKDYLNILSSNAAFPLITKPTRITSTSSTLLDHIITNITQNTLLPGILRSDLSDHFPTFCFILLNSKPFKITVNKKIRSLYKFEPEDYVQELALKLDQFFSHLPEVSSTNFDAIFEDFYHIIKTITNTHAQLKLLSRKQKRLNLKPWITKGILISIKCKKKLYWSDYVNGNEIAKSLYKNYANKLKQIIRLAKKLYFGNQLQSHQHDSRKTWKVLRELLPKKSINSIPQEIYVSNGILTSNQEKITNQFNQYFATIGKKLSNDVSCNLSHNFSSYLQNPVPSSMFLSPTTPHEIDSLILNLKLKRMNDEDDIPPFFLRIAKNILSFPLALMINHSFSLGIFPKILKTAKVLPIFKKGNAKNISNYRPISLLPSISKIYERAIYNRTILFFDRNNILAPNQFGFRKSYSTNHAILNLITKCYDNIQNKLFSNLILLDAKKAFDSVSHDILVAKLHHYGIRGMANDLFASYLANRQQYTIINNCSSNLKRVIFGVPQGSILGPLLFCIYVNDLCFLFNSTPQLYADDTAILLQHKNIIDLEKNTNSMLESIFNWMNANLLTVNPDKSTSIPISHNSKKKNFSINVTYNNVPIENVSSSKYLGLILDQNLTFAEQIKIIETKASRAIGIISKIKPFLPAKTLISLYYSLLHPHLLYGIVIWHPHSTHTNKDCVLFKTEPFE